MKKIIVLIMLAATCFIGIQAADDITESEAVKHLVMKMQPDPMRSNVYDDGQCTYYVFDKVKEHGQMIERSWHDAKYWAERAEEDGYEVNGKPAVGSILQSPRGKQGHVAYVEKVNDNGSIEVSEMNYIAPFKVSTRTIDADRIDRYSYIHPKENPHAVQSQTV